MTPQNATAAKAHTFPGFVSAAAAVSDTKGVYRTKAKLSTGLHGKPVVLTVVAYRQDHELVPNAGSRGAVTGTLMGHHLTVCGPHADTQAS